MSSAKTNTLELLYAYVALSASTSYRAHARVGARLHTTTTVKRLDNAGPVQTLYISLFIHPTYTPSI